MSAARKPIMAVRVEPEMLEMLNRFCDGTKRDLPATVRGIIEVFFAEGFEVASERLNAGLWAGTASELEAGPDDEVDASNLSEAEVQSLIDEMDPPMTSDEHNAYLAFGRLPVRAFNRRKKSG